MFDPPHSWWVYKEPPFEALPNKSWIEITHKGGGDGGAGSWLYMAPGSGIWYNKFQWCRIRAFDIWPNWK